MREDFLSVIAARGDTQIKQNEGLAKYSTFKIGGEARYAIFPENKNALVFAVAACREFDIPCRVIGCGSNVLFDDGGFSGAVIFTKWVNKTEVSENIIRSECGLPLSALSTIAKNASLSGLEFAFGIPGSVGGAVYMNAGAYGGEIKDTLAEVEYFDTETETLCRAPAAELALGYRESIFQHKPYLLLSATFALHRGDRAEIEAKMAFNMAARRDKQPLEYPSAGSAFRRPVGHFAAKLIDDAGLRGLSCGDAQVSEKHAGFIINRGSATSGDVLELCRIIKEEVAGRYGVSLETEFIHIKD